MKDLPFFFVGCFVFSSVVAAVWLHGRSHEFCFPGPVHYYLFSRSTVRTEAPRSIWSATSGKRFGSRAVEHCVRSGSL